MTLHALFLILISSFCWSAYDVFRKKLAGILPPLMLSTLLIGTQLPFFALLLVGEPFDIKTPEYWGYLVFNTFFNTIAVVAYITSVGLAPLSLTVPVLSLSPLLTVLAGYWILGESILPVQCLGIGFILWGLIQLHFKTFYQFFEKTHPPSDALQMGNSASSIASLTVPDEKLALIKGVGLMAAVAVIWSVTTTVDKICLKMASQSAHCVIQCLGITICLLGVGFLQQSPEYRLKSHFPYKFILVSSVIASLALIAQFQAIMLVPVGLFEALKRSIGLYSSLLMGFWVFKEPVTPLKIISVLLISLGVFCVLGVF
ncbi:MAG: DMT family transporter [Cyanobacteria bacterium]|nr:DMT family transporter [Cyanobacteriota bacterium]